MSKNDQHNQGAVLYLSVASANKPDQSNSVRRQRAACMREAEHRGLVAVEEFVDLGRSSASAFRREDLRRMLDRLAEPSMRYVITAGRTRLARNPSEYAAVAGRIERAGATLVLVNKGQLEGVASGLAGGTR